MKKSLYELSWKVDEKLYREDKSISYSELSGFAREGPKSLICKDKVVTTSMQFGSLVDYLMTRNDEENPYLILDNNSSPSKEFIKIVQYLGNRLNSINEQELIQVLELFNYKKSLKLQKNKILKFKEEYDKWYEVINENKDKIIIDSNTYKEAIEVVKTLHTSLYMSPYFTITEDEEILYQLKFKLEDGIKGMLDMVKVNYKDKTIIPIDIKTTSEFEEHFPDSFIKWRYDIQAELYYYILDKICKGDSYFKDFKILPFRFIVINKSNLSPIVWIYDPTICNTLPVEKTWRELLFEVKFHKKNSIFNYSYITWLNKGVRNIKFNNNE